MRKILGASILVALFGGLFVLIGLTAGWFIAILTYVITIVIIGLIMLALYLLED